MKNLLSRLLAGWLAFYEGGRRWGRDRSTLPGRDQDVRFDADQATRSEIVAKAHFHECNNALPNKLADVFEQFTVGADGLPFTPASSDEEWNTRAQSEWDGWCRVCDLTSLQSLATIQSLASRLWFIRGESFIILTSSGKAPFRPRIQLIEGHRVGTPSQRSADEGRKIIDGVEVDERGRPTSYWISTDLDGETYRQIDAGNVVHIFEPSRAMQYRGLSFFAPVVNELTDLSDLEMSLNKIAKDAAEISILNLTNTGELLNAGKIRGNRLNETFRTSDGTDITRVREENIRRVLGPRTISLRKDEQVKQLNSIRPSANEQWWIDYLTSKICAGVGISKLLVYPWGMQGTVTRADLDVQAGFFRARSMVLVSAFTRIYQWVIGWELRNGNKALANPPADWFKVSTRPPRSVNVDVGRNSTAMLAELEAGVRTIEDIYAELGKDWRKELRQKATERKYIAELAAEFGIPAQEIAALSKSAQPQPEPAAAAPSNGNGHSRLQLA